MGDDQQGGKINWGGLVKNILAGAAIVVGVEMVMPGTFSAIASAFPSAVPSTGGTMFSSATMEGIGLIIQKVAGAVIAGMGLSYLFSDGTQNENSDRHAERYSEAKESFALREDMRKQQAVMIARMKAAGHEPAMAMANQPQMG